ncbi:MAG: hypothetical protein LBS44_01100 [Deltaproteobacteria bacterium]|jgi:hypothetical protein|nr:hypothetical protein [Deltaproteobacteria bacterium]
MSKSIIINIFSLFLGLLLLLTVPFSAWADDDEKPNSHHSHVADQAADNQSSDQAVVVSQESQKETGQATIANQEALAEAGPEAEWSGQEGEMKDALLTPEVMLSEGRLTEEDYNIFIEIFETILYGVNEFDFNVIARENNVSLRRLNFITAKIMWPLSERDRQEITLNELGLGVLMDAKERQLFVKHRTELEKLHGVMKATLLDQGRMGPY